MEFFQKNKKIFLVVGIVAAVVILYELFLSGGSEAPKNAAYDPTAGGLVSEFSVSPADVIVGHELLAMLARLQSISLDASIFGDPSFARLKDKSKPIGSEPFGKAVGRRNPFSDFGKGVATTSAGLGGTTSSGVFGAPNTR